MEFYEGDIKGDQTIIESFSDPSAFLYRAHSALTIIAIISINYRINDLTFITTFVDTMNIVRP